MNALGRLDNVLAKRAFSRHGNSPGLDRAAILAARHAILAAGALALFAADFSATASAVAIAWGTALVLELLVRRPRPFVALGKKMLGEYWVPTSSFPSAHAAVAFACAGVTALHAGPAAGGIAAALAFLVASARAYVGVHYATDVIAGAIIGAGVSFLLSYYPYA